MLFVFVIQYKLPREIDIKIVFQERMSTVNIILDNCDVCYWPENIVSGKLECNFYKEKKVQGSCILK